MEVRPIAPRDLALVEELFDTVLGGRHQARLGEVHDVLAHPGFVAIDDGAIVGAATYVVEDDRRAELAALGVVESHHGRGFGGALVDAVVAACGDRDVWLVTTNDNLDALRLYQRHGFRLTELRAGAVDDARSLKPSIPILGRDGIPIHDELVLTHGRKGFSQGVSNVLQ